MSLLFLTFCSDLLFFLPFFVFLTELDNSTGLAGIKSSSKSFCFFLLPLLALLVSTDGRSSVLFLVFLGEENLLAFLPFGGGDMSTAPLTGDRENLLRNPELGKPLVPSNEGDLEREGLLRLFTGETILRPLGEGDRGAFFLLFFLFFFRLCGLGDRDLDRDLEYDPKLRGLRLRLPVLLRALLL